MSKKNKILVIGAGGIGSYLIEILDRTKCYDITIADPDKYEKKNLTYQLCSGLDVGINKAEAQNMRLGVSHIKYPILTAKQLWGYDLVICCADNLDVRRLLYRENCAWLDLRAQGRNCAYISYRADRNKHDTLLAGPEGSFSCQGDSWDGNAKHQHFSHIIAAGMGAQWIHRYFAGDDVADFKVINV